MISLNYGPYENFGALTKKQDGLYLLDNGQIYLGDKLMDTVHLVSPNLTTSYPCDEKGFITEASLPKTSRLNFYISSVDGEIRYVDSTLKYVNVSQLALAGVTVDATKLNTLFNQIASTETITMPKLTVEGNTLKWTPSNKVSFTTYTPKN